MDASPRAISPLRQRMIDDMRMRKLAEKTQRHYLRRVRRFAVFLGRSPDTATVEDLRRYQLHLVDHGTSPVSLNAAITGLKFFFEVTLGHGELMAKMEPVRVPRTLPVVLSREEAARLIAAAAADSGRLYLTRPAPDFSVSASSPNPASDHRHHPSPPCQPPMQRPAGTIAPACGTSNPHSRLASPNGIGARRGFLPRGLCNTCPRGVVKYSLACVRGQASHNP
jgi:hypothetical protein